MRPSELPPTRDIGAPLVAAAMLAQEGEFAVSVVMPDAREGRVMEAELAAEQAGVDVAVERTAASATVHFIARHQDRRLAPGSMRGQSLRLRSLVGAASLGELPATGAPPSTPRQQAAPPVLRMVDLVAFQKASDALALNEAQDAEAELIWRRLLTRARAGARVRGHADAHRQ